MKIDQISINGHLFNHTNCLMSSSKCNSTRLCD